MDIEMKTIIKVTSILALTAAAFLAVSAVNTDSASADEPVIEEIGTIVDVSTIDPCLFIDFGSPPDEPETPPAEGPAARGGGGGRWRHLSGDC